MYDYLYDLKRGTNKGYDNGLSHRIHSLISVLASLGFLLSLRLFVSPWRLFVSICLSLFSSSYSCRPSYFLSTRFRLPQSSADRLRVDPNKVAGNDTKIYEWNARTDKRKDAHKDPQKPTLTEARTHPPTHAHAHASRDTCRQTRAYTSRDTRTATCMQARSPTRTLARMQASMGARRHACRQARAYTSRDTRMPAVADPMTCGRGISAFVLDSRRRQHKKVE